MDDLMKSVYAALGFTPEQIQDARKCMHGNAPDEICLSCEKQEERRQEAREVMEEYRRAKDGE